MADGPEEDFSQLPLPDRFAHKNWKVRKEGYEASAKEFELTPDESDPAFRPFLSDPSLWKSAAGDSNVAAQQEGLAALCAFLKYGGQQAATKSRNFTLQPIYEKGLSSTRPQAKASALEALLLYIELDKSEPVIEELLPALSHKQPKVIAATLNAITAIYHNYGVKIVEPKPVLKALPKVFGHADKNVRAEAQALTVELYRWLKEAMKPVFWGELKPVQQQDLEKLFEKVKEEPSPKQERLTRSQQAAQASAPAASGGGEAGGADGAEEEEEEEAEVNAFDLAEPVDVYSKIPANFHEMIASTKWKERKEALDALFNILNTPRIKEGPFDELIRAFAKSMKDANIAVVTIAANCVEKLAQGLRRGFAKYRSSIMSPMLERFKEKKQSVADALGAALDAVFTSTSLSECLEETLGFLQNKNPNVKAETIKFLVRCLRTTRDVPSKPEQKLIADAATKLLTESTEAIRSGGAEILGTLMKIIGERAMGPYLDGLDDIRKVRIKEFFDTAEVKAKEKPKAAPPPPAKSAPAVGKKVVGGTKKPVAKKPASAAAPPVEDTAPLQPKSTAKPLPKPGLARPGLAPPSALRLGGLKKPGAGALSSATNSPQRRVISPPMSNDGDDEVAAPSPSKFGMGRGGLAGRPLSRPATAPLSPPSAPSVANGLSAIERAELEELRAERERLSALSDSLRGSNAKLSAEISELQNQNAQLIEDHTRDVLQIKAKETQLVRARGECDVLKSEIESLRKESERYKREVSRLGRESIGREREDVIRGRTDDEAGGIYDDSTVKRYPPNGDAQPSRPVNSTLQRTGSAASSQSGRALSNKPRPQSGYNPISPSEEKENGGFDPLTARRKISPPVGGMTNGSGMSSPQRPTFASREASESGSVGSREPRAEENWKRAAEVTSQLKARIEAMKARQGLTRH
ncbi:armadillo-type protein [Exophiala viscosa]|uniref:Armadillo-type protein n=1 Tax=Exophiala viscosa TaxID=2486360 RepID=A0AAN6I815_9EURO|nr:armadillo-type protein [Exophiala viscosa]KAI1628360.1 armadillo-type protein [Exophiala viscosa]